MVRTIRVFVAPVYLFGCLVLGGSGQGIWQNMVLQLAGIAILAWAAFEPTEEPTTSSARQLLILAIFAVAVVAVQMVPLPLNLWMQLGPRKGIAEGFRTVGVLPLSEPLSLTPYPGLYSLLSIIPCLAVVCAIVRLRAYRSHWLAAALITGTLSGIALGALQVSSSTSQMSAWYLYEDTNVGKAVGFFANANHMATLLLITIPFLAAVVAASKKSGAQRYSALVAIIAGVGLLVLVGLTLNGSLAGYGLALPVVAASSLIMLPRGGRLRLWIAGIVAALVILAVVALETTSIGGAQLGQSATNSVQSRAEILATTSKAAQQFMPFGSGLGSFRSVYALYERPEQVTTTYVVHAHNDYAEIWLELGVAGLLLISLFMVWWVAAVSRVWRSSETGAFARAAAVASATVLVHSLVDFPLRTAAISACFGMCIALLADSRGAAPSETAELRRPRHVTI